MRRSLFLLALGLAGCFSDPLSGDDESAEENSTTATLADGTATQPPGTVTLPECPYVPECSAFSSPIVGKKHCDDGNPFTVDRCAMPPECGGFCVHTLAECDSLDSPDTWAEICNDNDPLTADVCSTLDACLHIALTAGH